MRWTLLTAAAAGIIQALWLIPPALGRAGDLAWYATAVTLVLSGAVATAASDPFRHWLLVSTVLLLKFLLPVWAVTSILEGRMAPAAGLWIAAMDAAWWLPLALVLTQIRREHLQNRRSTLPSEVVTIALRAGTSTGQTIAQMSLEEPLMLVFLRHSGCMFCREALADIAAQRRAIEAEGFRIVLVHMGTSSRVEHVLSRYGLSDLPRVSDPSRALYRAFGLGFFSPSVFFRPDCWWRAFDASILQGHGLGWITGNIFQMPGVFLVFHGEVLKGYRHQHVTERPNYVTLLDADLA